MSADYSIQVLGGLSIADGEGNPIELASRKAEAIIIYLLFADKISCEREEIATLLWEDMPESNALTNLRVTLAAIKKQCGALLTITRRRVSINPKAVIACDRLTLEETIDEVIASGIEKKEFSLERAKILSDKLPLYCGDFLQGFFIRNAIAFEDWVAYKRESLRRGVIDASQMLIHTYKLHGMFSEAIEAANQLLFIDSFNDAAHRWLIELYALHGQREKALDTFKAYTRMLKEEIGMEPAEEVNALVEMIRDGSLAAEAPISKAVEKAALPVPNNIPMEHSPFFGRKAELTQLRDYLHNPHLRLITMIGQGGIGKTRLAIEAALQNINLFPDGVWFVRLEGVVSADLVLPEIYKVMGIVYPHKEQAQQQLVDYLNGHHVLVVLDNFEHLLGASAIISDIIKRTENSKLIVTSREMTGLPEETNMYLSGLEGGEAGEIADAKGSMALSSASQMFIERSKRVMPEFDPQEKDIEIIENICELVARLPLGIELAAAGLKSHSLAKLHDQIAEDITFLESDQPELQGRQRSLMSVFNTFWDQLAEDEQSLISSLSVFCGVLTQEAAKQVAGVSVFFLSNLIARGFLKRAGSYGYQTHSMHRQYLQTKLMQDTKRFEEVSRKHRDYYFAMLEQIVRPLRDSPQKVMLDELEIEMCNVRSALQYTIAKGEKQKALGMCELLMPFWKIRGYYQEGYHWLDQVFELPGNANPVMESSALCAAAKLVSVLGDHTTAEAYSRKSLKIATETGDQHGIARALNSLGAALAEKGDPQRAEEIYSESLEIYRNLRVQQAIAGTLVNLANMEIESGKIKDATHMLDEALRSFRLVGDSIGVIHVLLASAKIAVLKKESRNAFKTLKEALEKAWELSAREELTCIYLLIAQTHALEGSWDESAQLLALIKQVVRRHKIPLTSSEEQVERKVLEKVKKAMGEAAFEQARHMGELAGEAAIVKRTLQEI